MEVQNIAKEIYDSGKRLEAGSKKLFGYAKKMAETEAAYRKQLAMEMLRLKSEGMAVTLIPDICRGLTSSLKFERDLAEAEYKSARDMLQAISTQVNSLQSILKFQQDI